MSSAKTRKSAKPNYFLGVGIGLVILALLLLYRIFRDPVQQEFSYAVRSIAPAQKALTPPNTDFALVIDKLGASAAIISGVDPYNILAYQRALTHGVAHAEGTSYPGAGGNIFLFAHSSADILTAQRYNSVFYLMHHFVPGDLIKIWYQGREYDYTVSDKKIVSPGDTSYLTKKTSSEQLTLMTCWPPGTTLKRLIIVAKPI